MPYIGIPPFGQTVRTVTTITASASQTAFTPTGGYIVGYVDVYYNGVKLIDGDDYTATNGSTVTLTTAANAGDSVELVSYMPVSLADTYRQAEADSRFVNVTGDTMSGNLNVVNGTVRAGYDANIGVVIGNGGAVPSSDLNAYILWGNDSAFYGVNGDMIYIPRTSTGARHRFYTGSGTPQQRMMIDEVGRVTMPYQPAFNAFWNSSNSINYSAGIVIFQSTRFNVGNHYSTSTGNFTAPISGTYFFTTHFFKYTSYTNPTNTYWGFRVNGSPYSTINHGVQGSDGGQSLSATIQLQANDTVHVHTDNTLGTYGVQYHHFSGYLIG